jgi:integrase
VAEWLRFCEKDRGLEETTMADYRRVGAALTEEFGASTPVDEVDEDRIEAYRTKMLAGEVVAKRGGRLVAEREDGKAISRRTAQKRLVLLGGIFRRAKKLKWIAADPTRRYRSHHVEVHGRLQRADRPAGRSRRCEGRGRTQRGGGRALRTAMLVAAYTGLRTGELRALRWRDVDFVAATIHIRSNKPVGGEQPACPRRAASPLPVEGVGGRPGR